MHIGIKCQTVAVLLLQSPCIHPVTHEETVILEENVRCSITCIKDSFWFYFSKLV